MRMRIAGGFEHFQLAGFNDGDDLRAFDRGEAFQEIFNGFASFEASIRFCKGTRVPTKTGVPPMISGSEWTMPFKSFIVITWLKYSRRRNCHLQTWTWCMRSHLRRERRWVRGAIGGEFNAVWSRQRPRPNDKPQPGRLIRRPDWNNEAAVGYWQVIGN